MDPKLFLLFPTPILKFRLDKHKEHKETYVPKVLELFNSRTGNPSRYFSKQENSYLIMEEDSGLTIQDKQLDSMCHEYINFLGKTAGNIVRKSWFGVHSPLMHIQSHGHFGCLISGVYYMQFNPEVDYPTTFTSPNYKDVEGWNLEPHNEHCIADTFPNHMNIEEGDVVLFPSWLLHYAPSSQLHATEERVSFVFNYLDESSIR